MEYFLGRPISRVCMDLELLWQLAFIFGLVGFGIWFSYLTFQLQNGLDDIGGRGEDIDDIREAVEQVVAILGQLPQLMPQFHMNQPSPLQPLIEMFMQKMQENSKQTLQTVDHQRGVDGRFNGTTKEEEQN